MAKRDDTWSFRERRTKADWAGVTMGDAFKADLDYYTRLAAQRIFYSTARRIQKEAAMAAGLDPTQPPVVRPQISPFYTGYPTAIAAHAALGMTAYLEFGARVQQKLLVTQIQTYLNEAALLDEVETDPAIYARVAGIVAASVNERLVLEDLARVKTLACVETYRLFMAAEQTLRFASLSEIVSAVVLYGDVLPDWRGLALHPLTEEILLEVSAVSAPFFAELGRTEPARLISLGIAWVRMICQHLERFLPRPTGSRPEDTDPADDEDVCIDFNDPEVRRQFGHPDDQPPPGDRVAPLGGPNPPALFDPMSPGERLASAMSGAQEAAEEGRIAAPPPRQPAPPRPPGLGVPQPTPDTAVLPQTLAALGAALGQAGGQPTQWEDMRSDMVEQALRQAAFAEGPLTGAPTDGHEVSVAMSGGQKAGGELFDRAVELSEDADAYERLLAEASPVTSALRRALYPDVAEIPETERLRTSGALDAARLALGEVSPAVWKRYRIREKVDRRGRAVLLIACDGSGSLNQQQMRMTKVLAAGWLQSTVKTGVQVLAGLYHSGEVRSGLQGTLVQWMHHPEKTPSISRTEAAKALVSLPDTGTGCQADAISIAFMVDEARRIARGGRVYMILISDCAWNQSFGGPRSGRDEVLDYFRELYAEADGKIHTTLVSLGRGPTDFDKVLDRVIAVPAGRLTDPAAVAEQIGVYVAEVMRERRAMVARARDVVR